MTPTELPAWKQLSQLASHISEAPLRDLIDDPQRINSLTHDLAGAHFDFTKQHLTADVQAELLNLASQVRVSDHLRRMMAGELINQSEQRAVLHSALRGGAENAPADIKSQVAEVTRHLIEIAEAIRSGSWRGHTGKPITDVVHIGIGGSNLGPELVVEALERYKTSDLRIHFVANIDAYALQSVLQRLNPETALFVIVSKSFGTLETQINAHSARSWFIERSADLGAIKKHFVAVTSNVKAALDFGLGEENILPLWDWVGGRFSLWSAVGLPILLSIGEDHFRSFLDGAKAVDQQVVQASPATNIPLNQALVATWNYNFLDAASLAVLCYDERLRLLPDYLQQLEMESNGKSVHCDGTPVQTHSMPIVWGGTGTNGQHAYHQLLHQGTRAYSADFIVVADDPANAADHHDWLLANALAQSQAMAIGYQADSNEPYRHVPGNHPSTTIVLDTLGPAQLGALLAVYEHKVFYQGVIWGINSFDQWGVELGKKLAEPIYNELAANQSAESTYHQDAATQALLAHIKNHKP